MPVSRLSGIPGIGVDKMGNAADAAGSTEMLRLENLDTDIPPPKCAIEATIAAVTRDDANSYLPFLGIGSLREAAATMVSRTTGVTYDPETQCVVTAGGLSGILNVLLATLEHGDEVVITDPAYAGLLNRIRLAGGVAKLVPLRPRSGRWRLDLDALRSTASKKTKAFLTMSPSMPSGIVHTAEEWFEIAKLAERSNAWIIHDAAMERILFSEEPIVHPASLDGMADRTITIGSASKEYRMIGWRVGWVVGPKSIMNDIGQVGLANVVCQVGIAMPGVAAALSAKDDGIVSATREWRNRCELILREIADLPVVAPEGGWSMLIDAKELGMEPKDASERLFRRGAIAATPMSGWGSDRIAGRYVRFVFANEPDERLRGIRDRIQKAWGV